MTRYYRYDEFAEIRDWMRQIKELKEKVASLKVRNERLDRQITSINELKESLRGKNV